MRLARSARLGWVVAGMLFCMAVTFWAYAYVYTRSSKDASVQGMFMFGGPDPSGAPPPPWSSIVSSVLALFAGILFGTVFTAMGKVEGSVNAWSILAGSLKSVEFLRGLFAAPLVFGGIYAATKGQPDGILAVVFAFQNGFFWESVLKGRSTAPALPSAPESNSVAGNG